MLDLNSFVPKAEQIANVIDELMMDELHLMPPATYELNARGGRVYLVASYNALLMGRSLKVYEHPDIARRLRTALGLPVTITKQTGTRYVVLMHGALSLPKSVPFPGMAEKRDVFRLGIGVKGEIRLSARQIQNVMIGAAQGMGKSNILELLAGQMMSFGWQLYLADPQLHTFAPEIWNARAEMAVAGSHEDMLKVLTVIENEVATRVLMFRQATRMGVIPADIDEYNSNGASETILPRIGFLIDEANFFLGQKAIFAHLADLLRQGRKWGLHIVVAAHEWHKDSIPAAVNDLLQTRIALSSLSGPIVLRSNQWGKWIEGRPAGRGVLRTNKFEPIQFYKVDEETKTTARVETSGPAIGRPCPVPPNEIELVERSLSEAGGKMTMDLLMQWGIGERDAREMGARYETLGWVAKDPQRGNARFVTDELIALLGDFRPNVQTAQTQQTAENAVQTASKPVQSPQTSDFIAG